MIVCRSDVVVGRRGTGRGTDRDGQGTGQNRIERQGW